jgi:hypothetical protein
VLLAGVAAIWLLTAAVSCRVCVLMSQVHLLCCCKPVLALPLQTCWWWCAVKTKWRLKPLLGSLQVCQKMLEHSAFSWTAAAADYHCRLKVQ